MTCTAARAMKLQASGRVSATLHYTGGTIIGAHGLVIKTCFHHPDVNVKKYCKVSQYMIVTDYGKEYMGRSAVSWCNFATAV